MDNRIVRRLLLLLLLLLLHFESANTQKHRQQQHKQQQKQQEQSQQSTSMSEEQAYLLCQRLTAISSSQRDFRRGHKLLEKMTARVRTGAAGVGGVVAIGIAAAVATTHGAAAEGSDVRIVADALADLAHFALFGTGGKMPNIAIQPHKAFVLARQSASLGSAKGQHLLAFMIRRGIGDFKGDGGGGGGRAGEGSNSVLPAINATATDTFAAAASTPKSNADIGNLISSSSSTMMAKAITKAIIIKMQKNKHVAVQKQQQMCSSNKKKKKIPVRPCSLLPFKSSTCVIIVKGHCAFIEQLPLLHWLKSMRLTMAITLYYGH